MDSQYILPIILGVILILAIIMLIMCLIFKKYVLEFYAFCCCLGEEFPEPVNVGKVGVRIESPYYLQDNQNKLSIIKEEEEW